ncbi:MAG TPA: Rossmann-like and DUF2520 domain-containing protein [Gemmatimonadales bacterium]|nr:Rossmann-like and DUF2520 domain-containing protein [Gemmatimonadales bacterium]
MTEPARATVGVIGPGRAGAGLALALTRAGHRVLLHGRRVRPVPAPLTLTVAADGTPPPWIGQATVVLLAVKDDAIRPLAQSLAASGLIGESHTILHLSGVLGQDVLAPLVSTGAALGSMHPLQTIADAEQAPGRLPGAWAAVEGMPRAMEAAEAIARAVGLRPFRVSPRFKAVYHAGAVFASNYFVVVEAVAQRLLRHAGLADGEAWEALRPLVRGTLENMERGGPAGALTGPVARGDVATIARHLEALTADDAILYRALGRAALELAQKRGMDDATAERVAAALATDRPLGLPPEA